MERRKFLGGLLAGAGAAAATTAASVIGATQHVWLLEEINTKIMVSDEDSARLIKAVVDAKDGQLILTPPAVLVDSPEFIDYAQCLSKNWFGASDLVVSGMDQAKYNDWMAAHMAINREYGIDEEIAAARRYVNKYNGWVI